MSRYAMLKPNTLKIALHNKQIQLGLWCALSNSYSTEIIAGSGYDWLTLDMEHSPNDLNSVLTQLQMLGAYPLEPAVRLVKFDKDLVKQYLDMGVRTLILPNVESAEHAQEIVRATRYPQQGIRGVAGQHRANRWGRIADYAQTASEQICVLVQIESAEGVKFFDSIIAVDGVDGAFIGPNDMAASMGLLGQQHHPEVQHAIQTLPGIAAKHGKSIGILAANEADVHRYLEWGYKMVGLGSDQGLLAKASDTILGNCRQFVKTLK
jgi:4-hydroxy-2-oxoheptanedioate aldolase